MPRRTSLNVLHQKFYKFQVKIIKFYDKGPKNYYFPYNVTLVYNHVVIVFPANFKSNEKKLPEGQAGVCRFLHT